MTTPDPRPTVLAVDDNAVTLELLAAHLEGNYRVITASSGEEGLEKAAADPPDVVLLDVLMPGIDGIETCRRLKASADRYLPVILLTGHGDQDNRNVGLEAGADDFLSKPFDPHELALRVKLFATLQAQDHLIRKQVAELRRLDHLKEDLVELVTHDLLNALSGILLLLEASQHAGAASAADLDRVVRAASRMRDTLQDMLRVKQLEDGVLHVELSNPTIAEVLEGALALAEPQAHARNVEVQVRGDLRTRAQLDLNLVRRSVYNLLQNAIKFSPKNDVVTITSTLVDGRVQLAVTDHGPGISAENRARLFQKYGRVENRSGHGLGLYLVQQVAESHHGRAWVNAGENKGSVFVLELPLRQP